MRRPTWDRRTFLATGISTLGLAGTSGTLRSHPGIPGDRHRAQVARGVVRAEGRGLAGVPVTDGFRYVTTGADGSFTLPLHPWARFVYLSLPAGYAIPTHACGTARCFQPIRTEQAEFEAVFDLTPLPESDEVHHFLLLADPQTETLEEVALLRETLSEIARWADGIAGTKFAFSCGDIVFDHVELFPAYESAVQLTGIPFFQVAGNHDVDRGALVDALSLETFGRHFGPDHYSFDRGAVHYVVLDDVFWYGHGYIGYITGEQLAWLEQDLSFVEPGRSVVIVVHIPLAGTRHERTGQPEPSPSGVVMNREALYELLQPYRVHILSGHTHENEHVIRDGVHEHIHGAVCGAWWSGPICFDGTPCGYGVYEVRGEEIRWRYQCTGKPAEHQMRLYPPGSLPAHGSDVIANLWDLEPAWRLRAWNDRKDAVPVLPLVARDPLSIQLHEGDRLPPKRPWVEPQPTYHLRRLPPPPGSRTITLEAEDRFGRVYRETLGLAAT
ncbi:MAG: calcineurin-like phosphoesterase family protein [Acidobacteriota bacterium]